VSEPVYAEEILSLTAEQDTPEIDFMLFISSHKGIWNGKMKPVEKARRAG
jgi:hypothetical protein